MGSSETNKNIIMKREYFAIRVKLISPLSLSNGDTYYTDLDVLRNASGEYFIPGTSLAGAFRNYNGKKKTEECIYGFSEGEKGRMSSVFISDMYLDATRSSLDVRDGVILASDKSVDNKFDMEIIQPGASGTIYLSFIGRENDTTYDFVKTVNEIIQGIQDGDIRFGARKNRGFGRLSVEKISYSKFEQVNCKEWIEFMKGDLYNPDKYNEITTYQEWMEKHDRTETKYIRVQVPLKLTGGISIRKYSAKPGNADFEHIKSSGQAVIPGSSWNGAIRSHIRDILTRLGMSAGKADETLKKWFGSHEENAEQSMIVISESVIEGYTELEITRNKINRFTSGTIESALYTEKAVFGGITTLEYLVKKDDSRDYKALLAMMDFVIEDIEKGYVPVGGQVSIGRGIFEPDTERTKTYSEEYSYAEEGKSSVYQIVTAKGESENG